MPVVGGGGHFERATSGVVAESIKIFKPGGGEGRDVLVRPKHDGKDSGYEVLVEDGRWADVKFLGPLGNHFSSFIDGSVNGVRIVEVSRFGGDDRVVFDLDVRGVGGGGGQSRPIDAPEVFLNLLEGKKYRLKKGDSLTFSLDMNQRAVRGARYSEMATSLNSIEKPYFFSRSKLMSFIRGHVDLFSSPGNFTLAQMKRRGGMNPVEVVESKTTLLAVLLNRYAVLHYDKETRETTPSHTNFESLDKVLDSILDIPGLLPTAVDDSLQAQLFDALAMIDNKWDFTEGVLKKLAAKGVPIKISRAYLFKAVETLNLPLLRFILNVQESPNIMGVGADVSRKGETVLHALLKKPVGDKLGEWVSFLCSGGASFRTKDQGGNTPLDTAIPQIQIELREVVSLVNPRIETLLERVVRYFEGGRVQLGAEAKRKTGLLGNQGKGQIQEGLPAFVSQIRSGNDSKIRSAMAGNQALLMSLLEMDFSTEYLSDVSESVKSQVRKGVAKFAELSGQYSSGQLEFELTPLHLIFYLFGLSVSSERGSARDKMLNALRKKSSMFQGLVRDSLREALGFQGVFTPFHMLLISSPSCAGLGVVLEMAASEKLDLGSDLVNSLCHLAVLTGRYESTAFLLRHRVESVPNADPNFILPLNGQTAMHLIVKESGFFRNDLAYSLFQMGGRFLTENQDGISAVDYVYEDPAVQLDISAGLSESKIDIQRYEKQDPKNGLRYRSEGVAELAQLSPGEVRASIENRFRYQVNLPVWCKRQINRKTVNFPVQSRMKLPGIFPADKALSNVLKKVYSGKFETSQVIGLAGGPFHSASEHSVIDRLYVHGKQTQGTFLDLVVDAALNNAKAELQGKYVELVNRLVGDVGAIVRVVGQRSSKKGKQAESIDVFDRLLKVSGKDALVMQLLAAICGPSRAPLNFPSMKQFRSFFASKSPELKRYLNSFVV